MRDILRRWNHAVERRHFAIQKAMIVYLHHFTLHGVLERLQVEHHSRDRIRRAFDGHFQHVIVAVPVRVGSRAKQGVILRFRQLRVAADVRRGKFDSTGDQHAIYLLDAANGWEVH